MTVDHKLSRIYLYIGSTFRQMQKLIDSKKYTWLRALPENFALFIYFIYAINTILLTQRERQRLHKICIRYAYSLSCNESYSTNLVLSSM